MEIPARYSANPPRFWIERSLTAIRRASIRSDVDGTESIMRHWRAIAQFNGGRALRRVGGLAAVLGLALALGACSKCDVPNLLPSPPGPHACHDAASPQ